MWFYKGVPYMCEPEDILYKLREQCNMSGFEFLRDIKPTTGAIMFTCPWHKGGQERRPSCGLITRQKDSDSMPVGTVHCFMCGTVSTLEELISNCFKIYDGGIYGARWLASNFTQVDINNRDKIDLSTILSRSQNKKLNNTYVTEAELASYRFIHPYMYQRHITDDVIYKFDIGYDSTFRLNPNCAPIECITFPVRDINGNCLFVARRAINSKIFNYPDEAKKPLYGLYELNKYAPKDLNAVYICESMLDALNLWGCGKYALALNGTGSQSQLEELSKLKYRKYILALDPDEGGIKGCKRIYNALSGIKMLTRVKIPENKDINDLTQDEINELQEFYMNDHIDF